MTTTETRLEAVARHRAAKWAAYREQALRVADRQLHEAKDAGRVVVVDATPIARADEAWAVRQAVDFMAGRRAA